MIFRSFLGGGVNYMVFRGYEWGSVFANRVQGEDFTGWTAIINENTAV